MIFEEVRSSLNRLESCDEELGLEFDETPVAATERRANNKVRRLEEVKRFLLLRLDFEKRVEWDMRNVGRIVGLFVCVC